MSARILRWSGVPRTSSSSRAGTASGTRRTRIRSCSPSATARSRRRWACSARTGAMRSLLRFCAALLVAICALTAPGRADIPNNTIRIGVLNDMTGTFADLSGKNSVVAAQMAAEDFAKEAGPNAPKIEIVGADHQNKADVGAAITRAWIDRDNVPAVVGLPHSPVAH